LTPTVPAVCRARGECYSRVALVVLSYNRRDAMPDVASDDPLRALMVRYQAGDADAFEQLYGALAPPLRRYLIALARDAQRADDLLQDTFLQLHRSRRTYNPSRPVRPWAFAVARHMWLMDQRTRRRKAPPHQDLESAPELPVPPEAEGLAREDELRRVLARLPADRTEALLLHHVWGFTFEEIGKMLGIRAGAARVRASRAMTALRGLLK
jgi:RNA polymerase sigma-70 factor, ECF subfamily